MWGVSLRSRWLHITIMWHMGKKENLRISVSMKERTPTAFQVRWCLSKLNMYSFFFWFIQNPSLHFLLDAFIDNRAGRPKQSPSLHFLFCSTVTTESFWKGYWSWIHVWMLCFCSPKPHYSTISTDACHSSCRGTMWGLSVKWMRCWSAPRERELSVVRQRSGPSARQCFDRKTCACSHEVNMMELHWINVQAVSV